MKAGKEEAASASAKLLKNIHANPSLLFFIFIQRNQ